MSLTCNYKDDQGAWQDSTSFTARDLPHLEAVARRADDFVADQMAKLPYGETEDTA